MDLVLIYVIGLFVVFIGMMLILTWGSFNDPIIVALNMGTAAIIALFWPIFMIYMLYEGVIDLYDRFRKD